MSEEPNMVVKLIDKDGNSRESDGAKWAEIGSMGLEANFGFINEAYNSELYWPTCYPLYNRMRRSDPEISIVRVLFGALASQIKLAWEPPEEASDADLEVAAFGMECLTDIEGGVEAWLRAAVAYTPFMGWSWWEVIPGIRSSSWTPPDNDPWRSRYDDNRIGVRRLAWRDHSSLEKWQLDDYTGRLFGMWQHDFPNQHVLIPLDKSIHLKFGDDVNPEGLASLEAVWRLERIKYGLEVVQGIGFEHASGYLEVTSTKDKLSGTDKANIKKAARAVMSAQEGNYVAWPKGFSGDVKDIDFGAATAILEAIQYYGVLKLQVFIMQWIALSATTGVGSFAAKSEDATMFLLYFNSMIQGFAAQLGKQLTPWIFERNKKSLPKVDEWPELKPTPVDKELSLEELGSWVDTLLKYGFNIDEEDEIWIRRKAGMAETIPESADADEPIEPVDDVDPEDAVDEDDVAGVMAQFKAWADEHAPWVSKLLSREVEDESDS